MKTLFVLGAGAMGAGIAQTGLQHGLKAILCDTVPAQLARAQAGIEANLARSVGKGRITEQEKADMLSRLSLSGSMEAAAEADYAIEAITESEAAKKSAWAELSRLCRPDALLGSNTSTLSITSIASAVAGPERFLGTHFFNPVPVMQLLELVRGQHTSEQTVERARELAALLGKVTILSKDSAGFIANRIGSPMLNAAVNVYDSGVGTAEDVDRAMKLGWGFPMGPLELIDLVGVDVQLAVMEVLYAEYGDPYYKPAPLLKRMAAAGRLGRKTGRGFYQYGGA